MAMKNNIIQKKTVFLKQIKQYHKHREKQLCLVLYL